MASHHHKDDEPPAPTLKHFFPTRGIKSLVASAWLAPPFDTVEPDPMIPATAPGAKAAAAAASSGPVSSLGAAAPVHKGATSKTLAQANLGDTEELLAFGAEPASSLLLSRHSVNQGNVFAVSELVVAGWQLQAIVVWSVAPGALAAGIGTSFGRFAAAFALDLDATLLGDDAADDTRREVLYRVGWMATVFAMIAAVVNLRQAAAAAAVSAAVARKCNFVLKHEWPTHDPRLQLSLRGSMAAVAMLFLPMCRVAIDLILCGERYKYSHGPGQCPLVYDVIAGGAFPLVVLAPLALWTAYTVTARNRSLFAPQFDALGKGNSLPEAEHIRLLERAIKMNPGVVLVAEYVRGWLHPRFATMAMQLLACVVGIGVPSLAFLLGDSDEPDDDNNSTPSPSPSTTASTGQQVAIALILGVQVIAFLLALASRQFLSSSVNILSVSLQLFGLGMTASTLVAALNSDMGSAAEIPYGVCGAFALAAAIAALMFTSRSARDLMRLRLGQVHLAPVSDADRTPLWLTPSRIDFEKQRQLTVWQPFWEGVLTAADPFRLVPPEATIDRHRSIDRTSPEVRLERATVLRNEFDCYMGPGRTPYLYGYRGSAGERFIENAEIAAAVGAEAMGAAAETLEQCDVEGAIVAARLLHGPDCFVPEDMYEEAVKRKHRRRAAAGSQMMSSRSNNNSGAAFPDDDDDPDAAAINVLSKSAQARKGSAGVFGCLYVIPFPFQAVFIPDRPVGAAKWSPVSGDDDADDDLGLPEVSLELTDMALLAAANGSPDIVRRRLIRLKLRALALACLEDGFACQFIHRERRNVKIPKIGEQEVVVSYDQGEFVIDHDTDEPAFDASDSHMVQGVLESVVRRHDPKLANAPPMTRRQRSKSVADLRASRKASMKKPATGTTQSQQHPLTGAASADFHPVAMSGLAATVTATSSSNGDGGDVPADQQRQRQQQQQADAIDLTAADGDAGCGTSAASPKLLIVPGFRVALKYTQGTYEEHGGGTVGPLTIGVADLGITPTLEDTTELRWLIDSNALAIEHGLAKLRLRLEAFRMHYAAEFAAKNTALSYAFWTRVLANDRLPKDELCRHLSTYETNPMLRHLVQPTQEPLIETLYWRLAFYDSCPALAVWCGFWTDLYRRNRDLGAIANGKKAQELLDPRRVGSIVWTIGSKEHTLQRLIDAELQDPQGGGIINRGLVDDLFDAMTAAVADVDSSPSSTSAAAMPTFTVEVSNTMLHPELCEPLRQRASLESAIVPLTEVHRYDHPILSLAPWAADVFAFGDPPPASDATNNAMAGGGGGGPRPKSILAHNDPDTEALISKYPILRYAIREFEKSDTHPRHGRARRNNVPQESDVPDLAAIARRQSPTTWTSPQARSLSPQPSASDNAARGGGHAAPKQMTVASPKGAAAGGKLPTVGRLPGSDGLTTGQTHTLAAGKQEGDGVSSRSVSPAKGSSSVNHADAAAMLASDRSMSPRPAGENAFVNRGARRN